jgi:hypothetical protein
MEWRRKTGFTTEVNEGNEGRREEINAKTLRLEDAKSKRLQNFTNIFTTQDRDTEKKMDNEKQKSPKQKKTSDFHMR